MYTNRGEDLKIIGGALSPRPLQPHPNQVLPAAQVEKGKPSNIGTLDRQPGEAWNRSAVSSKAVDFRRADDRWQPALLDVDSKLNEGLPCACRVSLHLFILSYTDVNFTRETNIVRSNTLKYIFILFLICNIMISFHSLFQYNTIRANYFHWERPTNQILNSIWSNISFSASMLHLLVHLFWL